MLKLFYFMEITDELFDLVIIGAAAVGTPAAIYAARRNLKFIVVAKDVGGEVALSGEVENWPGIPHTTGIELSQNFQKHMQYYNVPIDNGFTVMEIKHEKNIHIVVAKDANGNEKTYRAKTIIIGSGIHPRTLNVPGEADLRGKGVTSCTVCDGPLFRGKITATIGSGNSALESAIMMSGIAKKVYVITKYPNTPESNGGFPPGENILIDKVKSFKNVEIIYNASTAKILGGPVVTGLQYKDIGSGETREIAVQGIMVHIGVTPNSDFIQCVKKNKLKEIEIDTLCRTNCPGIFAAGDVTNVPYRQIAIAAGHGVTAALSAIGFINRWKA